MKILLIGAHPDDIELGAAGTIAKHVTSNDEVYAIICSNGERIGDARQRQHDANQSAMYLGIQEIYFLKLQDTMIKEDSETIDRIERIIDRIGHIDRVYTHSSNDTNQDHRNVSKASISACRNIRQVLFYESPSSSIDFMPDYFIDITEFIKMKLEALKIYKSLNRRYLEVESTKGQAQFRAYQAKITGYSEGFKIFKFVEEQWRKKKFVRNVDYQKGNVLCHYRWKNMRKM